MRAGQKGEPAIMLDDPVIVFGKAKLGERVVERSARGDEQCRHMQATPGFLRIPVRHEPSSAPRVLSRLGDSRRRAGAARPKLRGSARPTRLSNEMTRGK